MGTCLVLQEEASAGFSHWALLLQDLDDFGKNHFGVACGSQCSFLRQNVDYNRTIQVE